MGWSQQLKSNIFVAFSAFSAFWRVNLSKETHTLPLE